MENSKKIWFKRKLYGWGWTPRTWEGWVLTVFYVLCMTLFSLRIDENSGSREVIIRFVLPFLFITAIFIWIVYKKGEKPRWQWGKDLGDE